MKPVFSILLFAFSFISYSQNVVHWNFSSKKISDKTYEVYITATIDDDWHIYSQSTPKEGPSLPTKITFNKNPLLSFQGKVKEVGKMVTKHEEILDVDLKYFQTKVDFVQVVKLKSNAKTSVSGSIEYMACTDERCLLPTTEKFSILIGN
jgi:thiol:disulfide interchange protein DsbD